MKPLRRFVPLDKALHNRALFDCGVDELNTFLRQNARRGMDTGVNYTWVLPATSTTKDEKKRVCAWYTLTVSHIEHANLPAKTAKHLPHYPLPVFVLAQLAVDRQLQGHGLGDITLVNALRRCSHLSQGGQVPSVAVVVDVLNDAAMAFYRRYPDIRGQFTYLFKRYQRYQGDIRGQFTYLLMFITCHIDSFHGTHGKNSNTGHSTSCNPTWSTSP